MQNRMQMHCRAYVQRERAHVVARPELQQGVDVHTSARPVRIGSRPVDFRAYRVRIGPRLADSQAHIARIGSRPVEFRAYRVRIGSPLADSQACLVRIGPPLARSVWYGVNTQCVHHGCIALVRRMNQMNVRLGLAPDSTIPRRIPCAKRKMCPVAIRSHRSISI